MSARGCASHVDSLRLRLVDNTPDRTDIILQSSPREAQDRVIIGSVFADPNRVFGDGFE